MVVVLEAFIARGFDRILLDARIKCLLDGPRAMGFLSQHRGLFPVYKRNRVKISTDYEKWMQEQIQNSQYPLLEDPKEWRGEVTFVGAAASQP